MLVSGLRALQAFLDVFLKVVKYGPYGHYHAHYDSSRKSDYPDGTKCCHFDMENAANAKCRICRYVRRMISLILITLGQTVSMNDFEHIGRLVVFFNSRVDVP